MKEQKVKAKRILLVDEDEGYCRMLREASQGANLAVDYITSLANLSSLAALASYDLVVLDYDLASPTGLEAAEVLAQHLPSQKLMMLTSGINPWQNAQEYLPNVKGIASKWDGVDGIVREARKLCS